jgi:hypothetical protein
MRNAAGAIVELSGAGIVRPSTARTDALTAAGTVDCGPCAARNSRNRANRGSASTTAMPPDLMGKIDTALSQLTTLERRTRHLVAAERADQAARLRRG